MFAGKKYKDDAARVAFLSGSDRASEVCGRALRLDGAGNALRDRAATSFSIEGLPAPPAGESGQRVRGVDETTRAMSSPLQRRRRLHATAARETAASSSSTRPGAHLLPGKTPSAAAHDERRPEEPSEIRRSRRREYAKSRRAAHVYGRTDDRILGLSFAVRTERTARPLGGGEREIQIIDAISPSQTRTLQSGRGRWPDARRHVTARHLSGGAAASGRRV